MFGVAQVNVTPTVVTNCPAAQGDGNPVRLDQATAEQVSATPRPVTNLPAEQAVGKLISLVQSGNAHRPDRDPALVSVILKKSCPAVVHFTLDA